MSRDGLWIDVGQARGFAGQIQGGLGSMQSLLEQIGSMIGDIYWEGDDKKRFETDWHGNLKPEAARAADALRENADELVRRAAAQEQLSDRGH
jgi:uncharacterized protein YukE